MDKQEANYLDMWATKEHIKYGRIDTKGLGHYKPVNLKHHLDRLKPKYRSSDMPKIDVHKKKPKEKEYGKIDKTNLKEL